MAKSPKYGMGLNVVADGTGAAVVKDRASSLASGVPVAAFPVTGPRDVIGAAPVGVLSDDLGAACLDALQISPQACVEFAAAHTWQASARVFVDHALNVRAPGSEGEVVEFVEDPHFAA